MMRNVFLTKYKLNGKSVCPFVLENEEKEFQNPMDRIGAGKNHTFIVNDDGSLWGCGDNSYGQLGKASIFDHKQPKLKKVKHIPDVRAVCSGLYFSLFIDKDNQVWGCGDNNFGQLGVNKKNLTIVYPKKMKYAPSVRSVAGYYRHSLLLDEEGNVWSTGENEKGQLGLGDNANRLYPEKIEGLPPIKSISCGSFFSMFVDFNGNVWQAGELKMEYNTRIYNQPTLLPGLESVRDTFSGSYHSIFINDRGQLIGCGQLNSRVGQDPEVLDECLPPMVHASVSHGRSLFIDHQGTLYGNGKDVFYDFSQSDFDYLYFVVMKYKMEESIAPFTAVSSGFSHTIFVSNDGSVYTTGSNKYGALGLGSTKVNPSKLNKIPKLSITGDPVRSAKSARNVSHSRSK